MINMIAVEAAYNAQKVGCKNKLDALRNPVEMRMTVQQYYDIWDQSGHWDERGFRKGQYCMSRHNDIGHYEVGNVKIILQSENTREAHKGKPKPKSADHCAKLSAATKGKPKSSATRAKMSAARKGKPQTEETKAKISATQKGRPGRKWTPEQIAKRTATLKANKAAPK